MRRPNDLSTEDLQSIVASIQEFLYVDRDDEGRKIWNPDKEWSLGDACDHVAYVLSQYDLVPEERQLLADKERPDILDHIDGPTFRKQRELLLSLAGLARDGEPYEASDADQELLEGLVNLTDTIADQAHDQHGIDCLLDVAAHEATDSQPI